MQKQHFFPLFLGDLLSSTSEWPGESVSLYTSLLAHQWFSPQRSIPSHPDMVRAVVRWDSTTFDRHWPIVSRKFVPVEVSGGETRLQNPRCEWHRERAIEVTARQAEAGRKGGLTRARNASNGGTPKQPLDENQATLGFGSSDPCENSSILSNPILSNPILDSESPNGDSSSAGGEPGSSARGIPGCPHEKIIALYHQHLPQNPKVREWPEHRRRLLASRWREDPDRQSLKFWKEFFEFVADSPFLTGKVPPRTPGGVPFIASLEWLIRPTNFVKVIEENYHRG